MVDEMRDLERRRNNLQCDKIHLVVNFARLYGAIINWP